MQGAAEELVWDKHSAAFPFVEIAQHKGQANTSLYGGKVRING